MAKREDVKRVAKETRGFIGRRLYPYEYMMIGKLINKHGLEAVEKVIREFLPKIPDTSKPFNYVSAVLDAKEKKEDVDMMISGLGEALGADVED
jgi:hypothetical protein